MRRFPTTLAALAAAALGACAAPEFPRRAAPEATLVQAEARLELSARDVAVTADERARLRALVAPSPIDGVARATVAGPERARRRVERIGAALGADGALVAYRFDPALETVTVSAPRYHAAANLCPDWRRARLSHSIDVIKGNPTPAEDIPLGCSVQVSIDAMVARPADLTAPPTRVAPMTGPAAIRPAERHRTVGPVALPEPFRPDEGL